MRHLDFETFSLQNLPKVGAERYAEDPSTKILLAGEARGGEYPRCRPTLSDQFLSSVARGEPINAHNAGFERAIWEEVGVPVYGWPRTRPGQWRCTAARAAAHALPRSLDGALDALHLPVRKNPQGKRLIDTFCKIDKKTGRRIRPDERPEEWEAFREYCRDDIVGEVALDERLPDLSDDEWQVFEMDSVLNRRGVPIDVDLCKQAIFQVNDIVEDLQLQCVRLTGLRASQRDAILDWLNENGCRMPTLDEANISRQLLRDDLSKTVRRVLQIRQEIARASIKKINSMLACVSADGRIRGTHLYHGASTGRWVSLRTQIHNLARGKVEDQDETIAAVQAGELAELDKPLSKLGKSIRGFLRSERLFLCADYNAIEARIVAWIAGESWLVEAFRSGTDPYCIQASSVFGRQITKADEFERFIGKQLVLGCGFAMGWKRFMESVQRFGIKVTAKFAKEAIAAYRQKNKRICASWRAANEAACKAVRTGKPQFALKCRFYTKDIWLFIELPSGRCLAYPFPEVADTQTPWGTPATELSYMGMIKGMWLRERTHGGKIVENIVQAIARDIMANGMLNAEDDGFEVCMTVHDEVIGEADKDYSRDFIQSLLRIPRWGKGLPVNAEGFATERYMKG